MEKRINKIGGILIAVFLVAAVTIMFYLKPRFLKHYTITSGKVIKVTTIGWKSSGDFSVMYEYSANNKMHFNDATYEFCGDLNMKKVKELLEGKHFPVAYFNKSAWICSMLITQKNADRFRYKLPDSLRKYDSILTCKPVN